MFSLGHITFTNHLGKSIVLDAESLSVGTACDLRSTSWNYEASTRKLDFTQRGVKEVSLECFISDKHAYDQLMAIITPDAAQNKPGKITIDGWSQTAFIIGIQVDEVFSYSVRCTLKVILLDGYFTRERTTTNKAINEGYEAADFIALIRGRVSNPRFRIAGNVYQVNVDVPEGATLEIDSKNHLIQLKNGSTYKSCFAEGVRGDGQHKGSYIFELIPPGTHSIASNAPVEMKVFERIGGIPCYQ